MKKYGKIFRIIVMILIFIVLGIMGYISYIEDKTGVYTIEKYYYVTFNNNGGNSIISDQKVARGDTCSRPQENPERQNYVFIGWYTDLSDEEEYDFNTPVVKDTELIAKWENEENVKTFTVTFDSGFDLKIDNLIIKEKENRTLPVIERDGYKFLGWFNNNKKYTNTNEIESDILLTAKWELNNTKLYTVTFNSDGGSEIKEQKVEEGTNAKKPNAPTKSGYTFIGWYLENDLFDFNTKIVKDITLIAHWHKEESIKTYIVTFNSYGGTEISSQRVQEGKTAVYPDTPKRNGYIFVGWYLDGSKFDFNTKIVKDITLEAHWQSNNNQVYYTVSFDTEGGSVIESQNILKGNKVTKPKDPTKSGYTFVEWQLNGTKYNFSSPVVDNITLKTKWKKNTTTVTKYTVTFNSNGGSSVSSQTVESGSMVTRPVDPTRSGFTFDGWYKDNSLYNFNSQVNSDFTLVAHWKAKQLTIPTLKYTNNSTGKWVFINNPEAVKDEHLADSSNKRLFYRDSFNGTMELYYEHTYKYLTNPCYYVIRFYNPGSSNVTLTVNRSGAETGDSSWTKTWQSYYSGNNVTYNKSGNVQNSFTIKPKGVLYFYHSGSGFYVGTASEIEYMSAKNKSSFDGVLNVTSSGTLEFAALGFSTSYTNTNGATYPGNVETGSTIAVYTGYYDKLPELDNDITFEIDDSVLSGNNLKVNYNGKTYNSWLANATGAILKANNNNSYYIETIDGTYKNDMINFKIKTASGNTITAGSYPEYKDSRQRISDQYGISSRNYNIANWAVHYNENITIKNTGSRARKITFRIRNSHDKAADVNCAQTLVSVSQYGNIYKRISSKQEFNAWTVTINPGSTKTIPTIVTLGGSSCAYIERYLYVEE